MIMLLLISEHLAEVLAKERRMREYIDKFLPRIYNEDLSYSSKLFNVCIKNHMYFNILFMKSIYDTNFLRLMEAFKVLTVLTTSMFILVVLFSAQYPSDDKTCVTFTTKESCLNKKSFGKEYCEWADDTCIFNEPEFSMLFLVFLAWLELLIVAPINTITTLIFDYILLAPTQTIVQEQLKESNSSKVIRRISQVRQNIRRLSIMVGNKKVSDVDNAMKVRAKAVKETLIVDQQFVESRRRGKLSIISSL